jgi:hypothetical protein
MSIWPRRDPLPITDPGWLVSTQVDEEEPEELAEGAGLDGRGTMHAANLPTGSHTWGHLAAPTERLDDLDEETPVKREKCLEVDPDGDYLMPGRCKKPLGHEEPHDWGANHGASLGETRRAELATPSGMLPRRTPGAALGDVEGANGATDRREAAGPLEGEFEREVLETWTV